MPETQHSEKASRRPEKKIGPYAGGIGVAIWRNQIETDDGPRTVRSITISPRRYRDAETGEWRDASSYRPMDLPALVFALTKAQEFCYTEPIAGQDDESEEVAF